MCHYVIVCRQMFLAIFFQIFLYFGIIALVAYWLLPLHDNIEEYFQDKVVWITGKLKKSNLN